MSTLKKLYETEVVPRLNEKFEYKNPMQVPRLDKIILNIGLGEGDSGKRLAQRQHGVRASIGLAAVACDTVGSDRSPGWPLLCHRDRKGRRTIVFKGWPSDLGQHVVAADRVRVLVGHPPCSVGAAGLLGLGLVIVPAALMHSLLLARSKASGGALPR